MKGQAWNVVETLKQADHGPLELTRRMRVCVWDDLVDVPVAIPMRTPSVETARLKQVAAGNSQRNYSEEQEEMDIGVGVWGNRQSSAPADLLLGSPTSELPNPNRFELTRGDDYAGAGDLGRVSEDGENVFFEPSSPVSERGGSAAVDFAAVNDHDRDRREATMNLANSLNIPSRPKHKSRFSFDFTRPAQGGRNQIGSGLGTRKHRSMSTRSGMKGSGRNLPGPNDVMYDGDDLEGDLGYSAAQDMEGRTRKVIVERLEAVKSKNPVFTWC